MSRFVVRAVRPGIVPVTVLVLVAAILPPGIRPVRGETAPDHLVVSEVVTGGASASDELIELYNPTGAPLPLEGLELVYVTASGLTVSRRAAWDLGAPNVAPGRHVLVANEAGLYAGIADVVYSSGIAASGGSVALRILGASTAIDAVGWGTASGQWPEGTPGPAPAPGSSLERRPGGADGSTQDSDDNGADFVEHTLPDPQNLGSPPTPDPAATPGGSGTSTPSAAPTPSAPATPAPTTGTPPAATPTPTAEPSPDTGTVPVRVARTAPEGSTVTIEGVALTGSSFGDGGGYVADSSAGIAVLLSSGTFERGNRVRITGTVDDRFAQRTVRAEAAGVSVLGPGADPEPVTAATGSIGETVEGSLVMVRGTIAGAPTELSAGLAFAVDDGSGPVRVLVGTATGIDTTGWRSGVSVKVVGVVGQRDSSGTGTAGYRVQPRDPDDVNAVAEPPTTAGPSEPDASPVPGSDGPISIAAARRLERNAQATVRGTVTLAPGTVDPISAVVQDATGAIVLRVGEEAGSLSVGERVEVTGTRSTLQGMETLRITTPPERLPAGAPPTPTVVRTGEAGEALEAELVTVRGALTGNARRSGTGSVSFELDDGSGPLRVYLGASLRGDGAGLDAGAWVQVTGVLGQETTGALPLRGYRVWPRSTAEVRVSAPAGDAGAADDPDADGTDASIEAATGSAEGPSASLADLDAADLAALDVGATIVTGPWPELRLGGLLWDGERLAALDRAVADRVDDVVEAAGGPPVAVQLHGLTVRGTAAPLAVPVLALGPAGDIVSRAAAADPPRTTLPDDGAAWVSFVGRLTGRPTARRLVIGGTDGTLPLDERCDEDETAVKGLVQVTGVGLADPARVVVPCGGVRPAPRFRAAGSTAAPPPASTPPDGFADVRSASDVGGDRRHAAAGLLGMGVLLLVAAATVARRLGEDTLRPPGGADDSSPSADGGDDSSPSADEAEPVHVAPQPLRLVGVPHDPGSP